MSRPRSKLREATDQRGPEPHRLTVRDYFRMVETGILGPEDRVELLGGHLIQMAPMSSGRTEVVDRLRQQLTNRLPAGFEFRVQEGLEIDEYTRLIPDCVVSGSARGEGSDIVLVVDVARSTILDDYSARRASYAHGGVPEYWIVSVASRCVRVYEAPAEGEYAQESVFYSQGTLRTDSVPTLALPVADLLPLDGTGFSREAVEQLAWFVDKLIPLPPEDQAIYEEEVAKLKKRRLPDD